jgi:hypothetical protein
MADILVPINLFLTLALVIVEAVQLKRTKKAMRFIGLFIICACLYVSGVYICSMFFSPLVGVIYTRPAMTLMIAAYLIRGINDYYSR